MSVQAKTQAQNKRMFALGLKHGFGVDELRELAEAEFGNPSLSELSFDQANHLIKKLGGYPFPKRNVKTTSSSTPIRTLQDRRKKAGVVTLASPTQIDFLNDLWRANPGRTEEGLEQFVTNMFGHPKPQTSKEASAVIEAVKSMNRRNRAQKEAA